MAGTVTRGTQTLPITSTTPQGAAHVTGSSTALDGTTIQEPFVILLDEVDPGRKVSPAGDDTLHTLLAALAPVAGAALSSAPVAVTSAVLLAANPLRRGVQLVNDTTAATLLLAYAPTATLSTYTAKIPPGGQWEMPPNIYLGVISGIWDTAEPGSFARITESHV